MMEMNKKRSLMRMVCVAVSMGVLVGVGCKEVVPTHVQDDPVHAPSPDEGAPAQDLDLVVEPDAGAPEDVNMDADMHAPVATELVPQQDARRAFVALATHIVEPGYHLDDAQTDGVSTWETACTWTPEPDGVFGDDASLIKRACRDLLHTGTISTVRDDKDNGSSVVQELWVWEYADSSQARLALCAMDQMAWGPFHKHPYVLFIWNKTRVLGIESRARFPKYRRELATRIKALDGVETIACK